MKHIFHVPWALAGTVLIIFLSKSAQCQFPQFPFSWPGFQNPNPTESPKRRDDERGDGGRTKSPFQMWTFPNFADAFKGFRMPEMPGDGNPAREREREADKEREERKERKRERQRVRDRDAKKAKSSDEPKDSKSTEEVLE